MATACAKLGMIVLPVCENCFAWHIGTSNASEALGASYFFAQLCRTIIPRSPRNPPLCRELSPIWFGMHAPRGRRKKRMTQDSGASCFEESDQFECAVLTLHPLRSPSIRPFGREIETMRVDTHSPRASSTSNGKTQGRSARCRMFLLLTVSRLFGSELLLRLFDSKLVI